MIEIINVNDIYFEGKKTENFGIVILCQPNLSKPGEIIIPTRKNPGESHANIRKNIIIITLVN